MSKGKYASKRSRSSKSLVLVLALVMLITATVGGTLAWLGDKTETVTNTFSASGIDIKLEEHVYDDDTNTLKLNDQTTTEGNANYKMVPGWTIPKDPQATVLAGSEDCYLFVKVERKNNFNNFMEVDIDSRWTKLEAGNTSDEVYYMIFNSKDTGDNKPVKGTPYSILADDQVKVRTDIKNDDMKNLAEADYPEINFTAYAVQYWETAAKPFSTDDAWSNARNMVLNSGAIPTPAP